MRLLIFFLLATAAGAQTVVPVEQEPHHHTVLQNQRVHALLAELAPGEQTSMHRHAQDSLGIILVNSRITVTVPGEKPVVRQSQAGSVSLQSAPVIHTVRNDAPSAFRVVDVEFTEPQGKAVPSKQALSRYCNPGSRTACVEEKYLFCSDHVCVSDVTMGEGAVTTRHSHDTDHMVVALTDYRLSDNVEGKGTVVRQEQSGGVEYLNAGITHQITNVTGHPVRFIVVVFR
ncbi:MAG: hypothetical protein JO041_06690 [Acidobacteria bacterium]|nr:hypothetical protein [Acidobacteriota bacterium]